MSTFNTEIWYDVHYLVAGQDCFNRFVFVSDTVLDIGQAPDLLVDMQTAVLAPLLDCWSEDVTCYLRRLTVYRPNSVAFTEIAEDTVAVNGTIVSDTLPAYVTVSIVKLPDNDARLPISAPAFTQQGYTRLSGVPESGVTNGFLDMGYEGAVDTFATIAREFTTVTASPVSLYTWAMLKPYPPPPAAQIGTVAAPIILAAAGKLGTQNTRKR